MREQYVGIAIADDLRIVRYIYPPSLSGPPATNGECRGRFQFAFRPGKALLDLNC